jgi:hypothetical protein
MRKLIQKAFLLLFRKQIVKMMQDKGWGAPNMTIDQLHEEFFGIHEDGFPKCSIGDIVSIWLAHDPK